MHSVPQLLAVIDLFSGAKETILNRWISYEAAEAMLARHGIAHTYFFETFASGVFDYFESVIRGEMQMGDCPVMAKLLTYLEDHDVTSDELFVLCSHFRRAMVDTSYDIGVNARAIHDEISYVFDLNFAGLLKRYTETIYQKEMEIQRNVKLLEEYRRAIDESAIVVKTDAHGAITYANARLVAVCGYEHAELMGQAYSMLFHPGMPVEFFGRLGAILMDHRVFRGTLKGCSKQAQTFYVDATIVPITDTTGKISEYMAISYEVTDLVVAKEEAIAAGKAKEYFLSNMSHEIRTPLNAILGFVALLKDEIPGGKQRRYLDIVDSSGQNLLRIINDILDFSKLRNGAFAIETHRFDPHLVLRHTLELFAPGANRQRVTLISLIDPHLPSSLCSDSLRLQQIVSNLLDNAIKFTSPGGEIRVEASCADERLSLSVSDTGAGIDAKELQHIFDPFSQGSNVDGRRGTGLGLSICAQLVRSMGGDIHVESVLGEGSRFVFQLPVSDVAQGQPNGKDLEPVCIAEHPKEAPVAHNAQPDMSTDVVSHLTPQYSGHLLVAEDDDASRELISALLENIGVSCDLVDNGADALEAMMQGGYDAVVMDEQMPQMAGRDAVARLRKFEADAARRRLPVIVLSADMAVGRARQGEYEYFLAKPVNVEALYHALADFLSPRSGTSHADLSRLDRATLCETLRVTPAQLEQLLDVYREKTEQTLQRLEKAVSENVLPEVALLAHALKGSSSNFRFETMHILAQQIETGAKAGDSSLEYMQLIAELRLHFKQMLGSLKMR